MLRIGVVGSDMSAAELALVAEQFGNVVLRPLDPGTVDAVSNEANDANDLTRDVAALHVCRIEDALEFCLRVAAAGKHLLVEPGQMTVKGLEALIAACARQGRCLLVAGSQRFAPSVRIVKQQLDSGNLGTAGLLRIHRWTPATSRNQSSLQPLAGDIDLACWMYGGMPTHVYAVRQPAEPTHEPFDYVQLHLAYPGDAMALLDEWCSLPAGDEYFSLSLIGSSGATYADDHHNMQLLYRGGNALAIRASQQIDTAVAQIRAFVTAIREKQDPKVTANHARNTMRVAASVVQSLESRSVVNLG